MLQLRRSCGRVVVKPTKAQLALLDDLATTPHNGITVNEHKPQVYRECETNRWLEAIEDDSAMSNLWIVHPKITTRRYLTDEGRKVRDELRSKKEDA